MDRLCFTRIDSSRAADVGELQRVMESTQSYYLLLQGRGPASDEAARELADLPEGFPIERKFFYLIRDGSDAVGCLDMLNGYPDPATAFLGLLLIADSLHGRGFGAEALRFAEQTARAWGCTRIRIGVIEANEKGLGFWKHCGFSEIDRRRSDRYTSPLVVLEKPL